MRRIWVDCDEDTILVEADPVGPTCHTGARTCFFTEMTGTSDTTAPVGATPTTKPEVLG